MATKINVKGLQKAVAANAVTLFYAPWCGHCKRFKDPYNTFAAEMQASHPNVHVTKINMDTHGAQVKADQVGISQFGKPVSDAVSGFPTVLFFAQDGDKHRSALYGGARTPEALREAAASFYAHT